MARSGEGHLIMCLPECGCLGHALHGDDISTSNVERNVVMRGVNGNHLTSVRLLYTL